MPLPWLSQEEFLLPPLAGQFQYEQGLPACSSLCVVPSWLGLLTEEPRTDLKVIQKVVYEGCTKKMGGEPTTASTIPFLLPPVP